MSSLNLKQIRKDLNRLKAKEVFVFGSKASGEAHKKSDIDVAVISRINNKEKNRKEWFELLGKAPVNYDIKIFELLPLNIQINAIENYFVVFGNPQEISEYFYKFRRRWNDVKTRYESNLIKTTKEKLALIRNAETLFS